MLVEEPEGARRGEHDRICRTGDDGLRVHGLHAQIGRELEVRSVDCGVAEPERRVRVGDVEEPDDLDGDRALIMLRHAPRLNLGGRRGENPALADVRLELARRVRRQRDLDHGHARGAGPIRHGRDHGADPLVARPGQAPGDDPNGVLEPGRRDPQRHERCDPGARRCRVHGRANDDRVTVDELVERRGKHLVLHLPRPGDDVRERVARGRGGDPARLGKARVPLPNGACAIV